MDGFSQSEHHQLIRSHFLQDSNYERVCINGLPVKLTISNAIFDNIFANCSIIVKISCISRSHISKMYITIPFFSHIIMYMHALYFLVL